MSVQKKEFEFVEPSPRAQQLSKLFPLRDGLVWAKPGLWVYPKAMETHYKGLSEFQFEEGDVTVISVPKCGSTWAMETVWTMIKNQNLDNPQGNSSLLDRTHHIDADVLLAGVPTRASNQRSDEKVDSNAGKTCNSHLESISSAPRPRIMKTHLSFNVLSPTILEKGKVIYVIRDPRDACLSHYHYNRIMKNFSFVGNFDQYIEAYMNGVLWMGPYWTHVNEAWKQRQHPNLHIMFYEKIKKNPKEELTKLDDFLSTKLTEQQIEKVVHHTSFDVMKARTSHLTFKGNPEDHEDQARTKTEGGFYRTGKAGGWKMDLTPEQKKKFDAWIEENCIDNEIMRNILQP